MTSMTLPPGSTDATLARMFPEPDPYVDDPEGWITDVMGEWLWSKQREIASSVRDVRRTAVRSCYGSGKSYLASRLVAWWLDVHPTGEAFAVTTAPTQPQVGAILWREIRKAHRRGKLKGRTTLDNHWYMGENELVAFGRKPADYVDPEEAKAAFQGIHAKYVLVILDEAAGIPEWLWDASSGLATNENARILAIGNPDNPASEFAKKCAPGSGWNTIAISAFDTPAFTDEEVPDDLYDLLVSQTWVDERAEEWGEGSMLYTSKVLGEFPEVSEDTLIHPAWVLAARERELPGIGAGRYGVDVARSGKDETVIIRNRDGVCRVEYHKVGVGDTMTVAGEVYNRIEPHKGAVTANIDLIGLGAGVFDRCREQGLAVAAFVASEKASRPDRFKNLRAEAWWTVRELFKDGLIDIDPADDKLYAQLTSIKWKPDSAGRTQIESKDDLRKRGLPSPDRADALMMSAMNVAVEAQSAEDSEESITGDLLEKAW